MFKEGKFLDKIELAFGLKGLLGKMIGFGDKDLLFLLLVVKLLKSRNVFAGNSRGGNFNNLAIIFVLSFFIRSFTLCIF